MVISADGDVKFKPKSYDEELCLTTGCVHTGTSLHISTIELFLNIIFI